MDGTERYLVKALDGETVETVWMPEGDDGETGDSADDGEQELTVKPGAPSVPRLSAEWVGNHNSEPAFASVPQTVGSKVHGAAPPFASPARWAARSTAASALQRGSGCSVTSRQAKLPARWVVFDRHAVQVGRDRVNLVFMGMGEPFLNYDNFMAAVRLLVEEAGLSPQRMTVSTSGIVPGIERFAREPAAVRPRLALSLNAPNDALRGEIMPINRKWPIAAIVDAVRLVRLRPGERVTFEYVLLGGLTDQPQHAQEVARLARRTGLPIKVNLIAWNPGPGINYSMPQPEAVEAFRATLADAGIPAYVRKPRGRDIFAACGQLKRTVETGNRD